MVLMQGFHNRPAAREQLVLRFGKPASKCSHPLERDLNFRTGINGVVMVATSAIRDGAEARHCAGFERGDVS